MRMGGEEEAAENDDEVSASDPHGWHEVLLASGEEGHRLRVRVKEHLDQVGPSLPLSKSPFVYITWLCHFIFCVGAYYVFTTFSRVTGCEKKRGLVIN